MAIPIQQIVAGFLLTAGIGFGIYAWHDQPDDAAPALRPPAPETAASARAPVPGPPAVSEQAEVSAPPRRVQQPPGLDRGIMAGAEAEMQAEAARELEPETPAVEVSKRPALRAEPPADRDQQPPAEQRAMTVAGLDDASGAPAGKSDQPPEPLPSGTAEDQAGARSATEEHGLAAGPPAPRDAGDGRMAAAQPESAPMASAGPPGDTAEPPALSTGHPPESTGHPPEVPAPAPEERARTAPDDRAAPAAADRPEESAVARALKALNLDSMRRTLSSLFGRSGGEEQPAAPEESAPATGMRPSGDVAQSAGQENAPPGRSLSEESIRQALRAATAGPGGEVPAPGAGPERDDPDTDLAALDRIKGPPPTFDIVRVGRDGRAVIAGRAAPGSRVEVRAGGRVIDEVEADRRGSWASMPATPLAAGDQELTVAAVGPGGETVESEQVVVVAVPGPPPPQPAPTVRSERPPPQPAELAGRDDGQVQLAAVAPEATSSEPLAVLLPRDSRGQGRVLQAPGRIGGDGRLALMVLDYDQQGQVRLTGEGPPGAPLRIYVDNEPAAEVAVGSGGGWSAVLADPLGPGTYSLRLDQLGPAGKPVARLETPFTRVSQPPEAGDVAVDYVIVQPGNSLWRIARRLFGQGINYVHIFDANRGQIRNPDLIYPGQVFEVPAGTGAAG